MKKITSVLLTVIMTFTSLMIPFSAETRSPDISADSYIVINAENDQILYGKNADKEVDPSGLSSLAIAYLYITKTENLDKEITINFNASDADIPGASSDMLGLRKGNKVKASDLLAAVFAKAYPDAVRALAEDMFPENYSESAVEAINSLFTEFGFERTHFSNIYGSEAVEHYISLTEYTKFISAALKNETFKNYFTTPVEKVEINGKTKKISPSYKQFDGDQFKYDAAIGGLDVKHLNSASRSLVAAAEKDGVTLITALIKVSSEEAIYDGAEELFEYGFNEFSYVAISPSAIPTKEIETTENTEFAKIFYEHTIDIYLNKNISTENLLYHINVPEDFSKENPSVYLEITQNQTDYQYEVIGKYPMTVKFENYTSLVPSIVEEPEKGKISTIDIIIIVIIVALLIAAGLIFWFIFQKKKRNQRKARFRKIEKLQNRSVNPRDIKAREEKENLRKGLSSVASEVENFGVNEDYVEPPVIVETQRTGTNEAIEAAKEAAKKKEKRK